MFAEGRLQALEQLVTIMQSEVIQARTATVQVEQRETDAETRVFDVRLQGVVDIRLLEKLQSSDGGHFLFMIPLSLRRVSEHGVVHGGRVTCKRLQIFGKAWDLCGVVGGVSSHRDTSRVHLTGVLGSRHLAGKQTNVSRFGIHRGTRWNGWVVLSQDTHPHTKHHDHRVEASKEEHI